MTLIKSISGLRGTIGGSPGDNLTPLDVVKFTSAFARMIQIKHKAAEELKVVVGRDARVSGETVQGLVMHTLVSMGIDVIDLGLSTTPTVEFATVNEKAHGGVILTASHNPAQWNALKLLNEHGEFLSAADGQTLLQIAKDEAFAYCSYDTLGTHTLKLGYIQKHIEKIKELDGVDPSLIRSKKFKVVTDSVHSSGGISVPVLLRDLGVEVVELFSEPHGKFPHDPEPLERNLQELMQTVKKEGADFGIAVDPDVDRLAIVDEKGEMFGEEYTLVACADYILSKTKGPCVSNLSSTRALKDLAASYDVSYHASAVGEVNVVAKMKEFGAVIGGEGNGGVIYPKNHYGRDALLGIALFLMLLSEREVLVSTLRTSYTSYFMTKEKLVLQLKDEELSKVLNEVAQRYKHLKPSIIDGVKIDFEESWVHLRKSNTEPIVRIYTEAKTQSQADALAEDFKKVMSEISAEF